MTHGDCSSESSAARAWSRFFSLKFRWLTRGKGHNSAFEAESSGLENPSILLNGKGNVTRYLGIRNTATVPTAYQLYFQSKDDAKLGRAKKYLLRLINTSFDSTFVFSIDNHRLQVITSDFVPIIPYFTNSILIGIGQRYNVIVDADPKGGATNPVPSDGNFWIRTWLATGCPIPGCFPPIQNYERAGILRYDVSSTSNPSSNFWPNIPLACSDEPYALLKPVVPWNVGQSMNGGEEFNVTIGRGGAGFPMALFSFEPARGFGFTPLQIDYANPTLFHLGDSTWPESWAVVPENHKSTDWVSHMTSQSLASQFCGDRESFTDLLRCRSILSLRVVCPEDLHPRVLVLRFHRGLRVPPVL